MSFQIDRYHSIDQTNVNRFAVLPKPRSPLEVYTIRPMRGGVQLESTMQLIFEHLFTLVIPFLTYRNGCMLPKNGRQRRAVQLKFS